MIFEYEDDCGTFQIRTEIIAAPKGRRPWPGYWSRWWYEIFYRMDGDEYWTADIELDGGGFTLRRACWNAAAAAWEVEQKLLDQTSPGWRDARIRQEDG